VVLESPPSSSSSVIYLLRVRPVLFPALIVILTPPAVYIIFFYVCLISRDVLCSNDLFFDKIVFPIAIFPMLPSVSLWEPPAVRFHG